MEKNIYIPGDLVRLSTPLANDDEIFEVRVCDPSRTLRLGYGKVLKGDYEVVSLDETRHILTWAETIIPIPITPEILEKNKWIPDKDYPRKCFRNKEFDRLALWSNKGSWTLTIDEKAIGLNFIGSIHQLQHLLFGLGLNSNMIV